MKIAILCLNMGIGDVIMTTPLIDEIKKKFPNSDINAFVSNKGCQSVLKGNPRIKEIITLEKGKNNIEKYFPLKCLGQLIKFRRERYDLSITCFPHAYYSTICAAIINAKKKIGHNIYFLDKIYSGNIKPKNVHQIKQNLSLIGINGLRPPKIFMKKVKKSFIGIHPGSDASTEYKRWDIKNFINLAKLMHEQREIHFFIGPDENELKEYILNEKIRNCKIIERDDFLDIISEINKCKFFIANDSGLMHVAEALNIPLIALFGATDEIQSAPVTTNSKVIKPRIYFPFDGALQRMRIKNPKRRENKINDITVEEVYKGIKCAE